MSAELRNTAVIVGVGESDIGNLPHMSGLALNAQAARRALEDAGLTFADVDGLLTAYTLTEPYFMLGTVLAEYMGIQPRYCTSIVAGGASPGIMVRHAMHAIAAGACDVVLICAGENRASGMTRDAAVSALSVVGHPSFEAPYGVLVPALYALVAQRYMHEYGTTRNDMAAVAVSARANAALHPNAQMRKPIGMEDVLASKPIADPLTMLDCCLISDAAGALVVARADRASSIRKSPAWIRGIGEMHTHEHLVAAPSLTEFGAVQSGQAAYEMAGVGPEDIDFAWLYDCFTIVPLIEAEELGLAPRGAAGELFRSGASRTDGRFPINTNGGLLSHAQAGAGGGIFGFVEVVRQLRGECGARQVGRHGLALVHNEGGVMSSHVTAILASHPNP